MSELKTFLEMGGYAVYVWPSYGLFVVLLVINGVMPVRREKEIMNSIAKRLRKRGAKS